MSNIELASAHIVDDALPERQHLAVVERHIGKAHVTFIGVEHEVPPQSYPWQHIRRHIERAGADGTVVLEYFPPELEQTIYRHPLLGGYARRYSAHAGITHFFGGVARIAAQTQKKIIVLDPANTATFQVLYLHLPLAAIALGTGWMGYEALQKVNLRARWREQAKAASAAMGAKWSQQHRRSGNLLQRLAAATLLLAGLEGVAWFLQDTRYQRSSQPLYRDYALHMRDMRWVTIAEGLSRYCAQHDHPIVVLYPPAHLFDGILHYLDHPEQRKKKYRFYFRLLPGVVKAIRVYKWEREDWGLVKHQPITLND
jgi:hypothetical protein